jgi:hypothetical protein
MRSASLLAAALLLLPAGPAAAQGDGLADLAKEFPPKVAESGPAGPRVALTGRFVGYDSPEGAKVLMAGLAALVDRVERDASDYEDLRKAYEEVNVVADVKRDDYKTKTELQKRLMEAEERQRQDGLVLEEFSRVIAKFQGARSLSTVSGEARRFKSWRGRAVAAEGLGANAAGMESAIRLGGDKDDRVTAAALRGLRGRNEDAVFKFAVESLRSESWPVRLEAALTLEKVNQPRVLQPLIEGLAREDGRLRDDLNSILRRLTSQNFDPDPEEWRRWWNENKAEILGPGPETALFGAFKAKAPPPEKKTVYGIESRSRRILFIIDTSGSMKEPIAKNKGTLTGTSADEAEEWNMTKIELAKRELKRSIRGLEPDAWFNIVSFGTMVVRWKDAMAKGDMTTKNEAYAFVRDMEAAGGTWAYGAFQEAFRMAGAGATDKHYEPSLDTIYFISDGAPTDNDMDKPKAVDSDTVLAAVREWNRVGRIVVHTVAIDPKAAGGRFVDFMKKLAAQNDGQYTQRE